MTQVRTSQASAARPKSRAAEGRGGGPRPAGGVLAALGSPLRRHPVRVVAICTVAAAFGAVLWNTLLHQSGRHPAPLFAGPELSRPARSAAAAPPLPVPRPDAATVGSLGPTLRPADVKPAGPDAIGTLIRTMEPGGAKPDAKSDAKFNTKPDTKPDTKPADAARPDGVRVAAAQRALSKLGYGPLKTDGLFGQTTRQAVERFERDRSLPVTGALGTRTARRLAQLSGVTVE